MENDLKFSGSNPVMINLNGSADDIYAPIKTTSCDVNIVSNKILDDLYTPAKNGVVMTVTRQTPKKEYRVVYDKIGSVKSFQSSSDTDENYTIYHRGLFFTDINNDYWFVGQIDDYNNDREDVNLLFNTKTKTWEKNSKWGLGYTDWYFHDGTYSYKVSWNGTEHTLQRWEGSNWSTTQLYLKYNSSGTSSDCAYDTSNIIRYIDGSIELIWGKNRWYWNNYRWMYKVGYTDKEGNDYFAMYGNNHLQLYVDGVLTDCCVVHGVYNAEYSNYIVSLNKDTGVFTRIIPLTDLEWDIDNVFSLDGRAYVVDKTGIIWFWSNDIKQWVKWISFTGVYGSSMNLDYNAKGNVVLKYMESSQSSSNSFMMLTNWTAPKVHIEESVIPGEYTTETIWEGYMTPNTYSQDVTQNLDSIALTAIDSLSIMKYITIDKIVDKQSSILTYKDLICKVLDYVNIDGESCTLLVEDVVTYGSGSYDGTNGLMDLKCQVNNFWDEMDEPEPVYDVISELLRPFCLSMYKSMSGEYIIYNPNNTNTDSGNSRSFHKYVIYKDGRIDVSTADSKTNNVIKWKSNNTENAAIEINATYDKVTMTASTCVPSYNDGLDDLIDYSQRDKYDYMDLNVQRNKTKGIMKKNELSYEYDTADYWYYLWNGVYTNKDFGLVSNSGYVNAYLNMNKANYYLTGQEGNPNDYGSILNFYGGGKNPTGTGKDQDQEKSVEIHKRVTAYAPDNGCPLEFLEPSDLAWTFNSNLVPDDNSYDPRLTKTGETDSKFGSAKQMQESNRIVYHQEYDTNLSALIQNTIELNLTQSYSRTGIDSQIDILQNNTATNQFFDLSQYDDDESSSKRKARIMTANIDYFPSIWDTSLVKVNQFYFNRYNTTSTMTRPIRCKEVWDKRRIDMYVKVSENQYYQFNGKEWVETTSLSADNCFYLMKLMTGEKLFHTDYKYNIIETSDGEHYSLTGEKLTWYLDAAGGVTGKSVSGGSAKYCDPYFVESNEWYRYINNCAEGSISLNVPEIDALNAKVCCDVYNSTMLGSTGSSNESAGTLSEYILWEVKGQGKYYDNDMNEYVTETLTEQNTANYGKIEGMSAYIQFMPYNTTYVKAEHLDVSVNMSVPKSNLGQMFEQSDIKYEQSNNRNYVEEFQGPSFRTNTKHNLVGASFSYIMWGNSYANPDEFVIAGVNARPEVYTVQAYMNWLSEIRKIYTKTIKQTENTSHIIDFFDFIDSPEVSNRMMLIGYNWDVKSNRYNITSIECQNMQVSGVNDFTAVEVPKKARNKLFNLPTAYKNK